MKRTTTLCNRIRHALAACAGAAALLVATMLPALAGPPPGTVITNQATSTSLVAGVPSNPNSNTVQLTVSGGVVVNYSAVLQSNASKNANPGGTVLFPHSLTNTGLLANTYTLGAADNGGNFTLGSITLLPDANGDGVPDSLVPIAAPVALAPGQVFRFVVSMVVPATAGNRQSGQVLVTATPVAGPPVTPNADTVSVAGSQGVADCGTVNKFIRQGVGPSPGGPVTIELAYNSCNQARSRVEVKDHLPPGFKYVPGSARFTGAPGVVLTDGVVGTDRQGSGPITVDYNFNVSEAGTVTFNVYDLPLQSNGGVLFDVTVDPGLPAGTVIPNFAVYAFFNAAGERGYVLESNTATYTVTGTVDLKLEGEVIPVATPGTTISFNNLLTNLGTLTDSFNITMSASTFPAGTQIALFKADGVTPLADTNGDGIPDTGPVAPGASYKIVVKVSIPSTAVPAQYSVLKTARSVTAPSRSASAVDQVNTLAKSCKLTLQPDNSGKTGYGRDITYTHFLVNEGNCVENVVAPADWLTDSTPGWRSQVFRDNEASGAVSLPGVVDTSDTPVVPGWTASLAPGQSIRFLVRVIAPPAPPKSAAKAIVASDTTVFSLDSVGGGRLKVTDLTIIDDKGSEGGDNVLVNYRNPNYTVPSIWGVIGSNLYLRADASACNADPGVVEQRTVVLVGSNGDREEFTAVETGPNTGIFQVAGIAVRNPPVKPGSGTIEGVAGDIFTADVLGCGRRISTVVTLVNPSGVVFDSANNLPVSSASVRLVTASGGQCSSTPAPIASPNPVVTGADGRFSFPQVAPGSYCLLVTTPNGYTFASTVPVNQLPPGRIINASGPTSGGSYGGAFAIGPSAGAIVFDIPVDSAPLSGLFIQKSASRSSVEIGEFVNYTVTVRNASGTALDRAPVLVRDDLPAGFAYVPGSATSGGKPIADPLGRRGPQIVFDIGTLAVGAQASLNYRVRVGPGALQGDGTNRVRATYRASNAITESNVATATVTVTGGVFSDRGYILGKVFLDCNANHAQDPGEMGVPGVRLLLEDGTGVITDGEGKYSFYGIINRTHVLKLDRTTIPAGAVLGTTTFRNMGDAGSLFVDLKAGELLQADFAITSCGDAILADVKARRDFFASTAGEIDLLVGQRLATEAVVISDPKALPASGTLGGQIVPQAGATGVTGAAGGQAIGAQGPAQPGFQQVAPMPQFGTTRVRADQPASPGFSMAPAAPPAIPLEELLPSLSNELGFVGLKNGETLPYAQSTVRVKGQAGSTFKLFANGVEVAQSRVGKRSQLADKQVQAWEYIGIELKPGENTLEVRQFDSFGNQRGAETITVIAPDKLGRLVLEVPPSTVADGRTPARIVVRLTDAKGVPVTSRTPVTLDASAGTWTTEDADPREPGLQVMVENGRGEFGLVPPSSPGPITVRAWSGSLREEARLDALPELRPMIAAGVVEGVINLRNLNPKALVPARKADGFEQELEHFSRTSSDGKTEAGARLAFFLKGKVKGEYLLTAAYDSDKPTRERLFRDIQPDEFYPIYGDSSLRSFDAQSTARFYVRVDKDRSYLLYGDYNTQAYSDARKLSSYSRSLTGGYWHYENESVVANVFAAKDATKQVIDEIRANGTSGPYALSSGTARVNSEKVEILVRDVNQSSLVISAVLQTRFYDYEFEPLTGRLLMKAPVPSVDARLNPVFIRVTYEADTGGAEFWIAGGDAQFRITNRIEVGASYAEDKNPANPFKLAGANLTVRLAEKATLWAEVAQTDAPLTTGKGGAQRIEIRQDGDNFKAQAFAARTDVQFNNPGAYIGQGRSEAGLRASLKISEDTTIRAEALHTGNIADNSTRDGALATVEQNFGNRVSGELGVRYAHDRGTGSPVPPVQGTPIPDTAKTPTEITTVRGRLAAGVPGFDNASVYGEAEVDVTDTSRHLFAVGGEYTMANRSRVYGRYEFVNSVTGPYGLANGQRQNATVLGVDTEYMQDGRLFSEYRIREAIAGGDTEAAIGLRNLWTLGQGVRLGTSFEHVYAISGSGQNENTAVALGLEYTANPLWKGTTRLEYNNTVSTEGWLFTLGLAARLTPAWTMLARNVWSLQSNKSDDGERMLDRMQAGLAWRDIETNQFNALGRVEAREEKDNSTPGLQLRRSLELVSINGNWQPRPPFLVSGRYAAKWVNDKSDGLSAKYRAQLVSARATWEFMPRWDVGVVTSALFGNSYGNRLYGVGLEVGYMVTTNLWLSAGYNFFGFKDEDLANGDNTAKGVFVRLRYKFDEELFDTLGGAADRVYNGQSAAK
jgi:uncharacterized repeat protein (TIGR01451 family)